ncbi:MAG: protein kinase [Myxococcales bacterium]|nr:protein kinase [Myxococcales bacterium]
MTAVACPGDETLLAFVEHALPAERAAALTDHVDACARCRVTLGHLAAVEGGAPTQVGRYRLEERLGAGGMGVVWAAWDPMLERRIAIKLLRPEVGPQGAARLLREARALAQLQHPNVVAVHDVGEHAGEVYLATELVDGEPLDRWQRGRSPGAIVDVYVQAARGLAAAHAMGLVHRDVKPSNIFVARDGRARIGDFGLARGAGASPPSALAASGVVTQDGAVVGTPAYMAPEQRAGRPVDGRADQFALCVALAEALGGARPAADSRSLDAAIPAPIAAVLVRGLAGDPDARFADTTALAEALAQAIAAPVRPSRSGLALRPLGVGLALAGLALASGVVFLATRHDDRPAAPTPTTASAPAGLETFVEAMQRTGAHDPRCRDSFGRFDRLGQAPPSGVPAREIALQRARCAMLAGDCAGGAQVLAATLGADGLAPTALATELDREVAMNCSVTDGPWRERLRRLQTQAVRLQFAELPALERALAAAVAIARDAGAELGRADHIDLTNALGFLEEGFARLAGQCDAARRARALGLYDPPAPSAALRACLDGAG